MAILKTSIDKNQKAFDATKGNLKGRDREKIRNKLSAEKHRYEQIKTEVDQMEKILDS